MKIHTKTCAKAADARLLYEKSYNIARIAVRRGDGGATESINLYEKSHRIHDFADYDEFDMVGHGQAAKEAGCLGQDAISSKCRWE